MIRAVSYNIMLSFRMFKVAYMLYIAIGGSELLNKFTFIFEIIIIAMYCNYKFIIGICSAEICNYLYGISPDQRVVYIGKSSRLWVSKNEQNSHILKPVDDRCRKWRERLSLSVSLSLSCCSLHVEHGAGTTRVDGRYRLNSTELRLTLFTKRCYILLLLL